MSEAGPNSVEEILRLCAAAAPEPWYPKVYAKQADVDPAALAPLLEEMWLDGLIEKSAGNAETGPGISLTRQGQRVLLEPQMLERLRAGQPIGPGDRGAIVRQVYRAPLRPYVTRLLVLLNVAVFAAGYYYARRIGAADDFLKGSPLTPPVKELLDKSGLLSPINLIDGEWWRLLTTGFVHGGFMHLLLNMVFLYLSGRYIEQMWGHVRYLVIYLVALLGGSCLGIAQQPAPSAGASAAVCGLLGAEAVWLLFNGKFLPRALLRQARLGLILSLVLLVFISSFPNVGAWGHFGGASAGALAALLLHLQRFGPPGSRWLALAGFVPLAWYGHYVIERARDTDPKWQQVEDQQFMDRHARAVHEAMKKARRVYAEEVVPVLQIHPTRRDPAKVEAVLPVLAEERNELNSLAEGLARAGRYGSPDAESARQIGREYVLSTAELFAQAEHILNLGDKRTNKDQQALRKQEEKVQERRKQWDELFQ
jgi:membrane associated rhomboid family serine protease